MIKKRERGAAAVEFGLILPLLLLLVGGAIDFGRLYYDVVVLSNAARDGARLATMGTSYTTTDIQNRVVQAALPLAVSAPVVGTCGAPGTGVTVTVTRATPFDWTLLGIVPGLTAPVLQGRATMTCP
jgi:Flp pilus assembly protein TadG